MIKYFLPNGREITLSQIEVAAQQSNISVEEYIQKFGITTSEGEEQVQPEATAPETTTPEISDIDYIKKNEDQLNYGYAPSEKYYEYLKNNPDFASQVRKSLEKKEPENQTEFEVPIFGTISAEKGSAYENLLNTFINVFPKAATDLEYKKNADNISILENEKKLINNSNISDNDPYDPSFRFERILGTSNRPELYGDFFFKNNIKKNFKDLKTKPLTKKEYLDFIESQLPESKKAALESIIKSQEYQEKMSEVESVEFFNEDNSLKSFGELMDQNALPRVLGAQIPQMIAAMFTGSFSTFAQEGGQAAMDIAARKAAKKMDISDAEFQKLPVEKRAEAMLEVVEEGEAEIDKAVSIGAKNMGLDQISNFITLGGAKMIPKNFLKNALKGDVVKTLKSLGKGVGTSVVAPGLGEVVTETGQTFTSLTGVEEAVNPGTFEEFKDYTDFILENKKEFLETAAQSFIVPGPVALGGKVIATSKRGIAEQIAAMDPESAQSIRNELVKNVRKKYSTRKNKILENFAQGKINEEQRDKQLQQLEVNEESSMEDLDLVKEVINNTKYKNLSGKRKRKVFNLLRPLINDENKLAELNKKIEEDGGENANNDLLIDQRILEQKIKEQRRAIAKQVGMDFIEKDGATLIDYINSQEEGVFKDKKATSFNTVNQAKKYIDKLVKEGKVKVDKKGKITDKNVVNLLAGVNNAVKIGNEAIIVKENIERNMDNGDLTGANSVHHEALHLVFDSFTEAELDSFIKEIKKQDNPDPDFQKALKFANAREKQYKEQTGAKGKALKEEFLIALSDMYQIINLNDVSLEQGIKLRGIAEFTKNLFRKKTDNSINLNNFNGTNFVQFVKKFNNFNKKSTLEERKAGVSGETISPSVPTNIEEIYNELQAIDELESNFNITEDSRARREELQQQLKGLASIPASKSVLEEINNLIPNTVKTKQDFQNPKVFNPIYESLTQRDKVINNYIRSRSESQEEANRIIDNVTERLVKFDPEQTRADGTKVGIEGFGEFIFANTRFGKLDARKDLFKESEKVKVQDRIDKPEAKQVKAEETVEEKRQVNLELPDAIIKTADRTAEVGVLASSKAVKALPKTATIKDKARAVRKASDELIKNQIQKDLKTNLLKVTKDKNKFKSFIDKNWESVGNAYLNNTNIEQLKKPSQQDTRETLENWIDNGFTKDDVYNFFTDPSLKPSTRSDRKNVALIRALVSEVANDARVKIIEKNPELAEEFKKENKVSLASIPIVDGNGKPISTTLEKFLPGYDINSTRPAQKVADALFKNQGGKIKFNNEKDINRMFDMLEKALDLGKKNPILKIPILFLDRTLLRPGPRAFRVDNSQEAKVRGLLKNKVINQKVVKEIEKNGNPKQKQYVKNVLLFEKRYKKLLERKDDFAEFTGAAKNFKFRDYNKVFGKTEKEVKKNWDKKDDFNATNLAMFEQTWRPIINLLNADPSLAPAFERLSQTGEGTANWMRLGAKVSFYSINPRGALDGKKFVTYRWEHAMQANNVRFVLLKAGMDGVKFNDIFYPVVKNYEVGALDNFYDKIITKGKLGNSMGPGWDFVNGIWPQRYANKIIYGLGGIPMNSLTDGTFTIGQLYNINERGGSTALASIPLSEEFNKILEENKGVSKDAVYSDARAAKLGKKNNPYKFFVPYSGEDYIGLIYPTLGKGKKGEEDLKWYKENLIDPYSVGISNFEAAKQNALNTWATVKSKVKGAKKLLNKEGIRDFSNEEAIRLYLWDKQGILPDGVAKKDLKAVVNYVKGNEELLNFANEIESITEGKYAEPGSDWLAGGITTDLIEYIDGVKRKEFLRPWKERIDVVYSKDNLNKLRAIFGDNYVEALQDILYRMETGSNRPTGQNKLANEWLNWVNNSVGGIMFFNSRSALLQTISSVNYINWSDNNPLRIAEAFGNQPQFWKDFSFLFNSDFLKQRRGGLQTDVNADEIAKRASQAKNKMKAGIAYLLKKGFIPTQYADSFAISFGGATFYRNRIKSLMKGGMDQKQAEEQAYLDWKEISEEAQQSSRPDRVSMQQASPLGRVILAFGNTPIQYARIIKKASLDLVNGRGDWKTNLSKIMWYGAAQNVIFTALQNALFAILFSDDDDEEQNIKERGKYVRSANSIVDTLLRGAGLHGAVVSAGKNIILKLIEETYGKELGLKKSNKRDLQKAALEITSISPPINSKIKKFQAAFRAFEYKQEREKMKELGFSIDNPAFMSGGRLLSVGFNIPADRLIQKMQNLKYATQKENEFWQSIGLAMGYTYWDLMMDDPVKKEMEKRKERRINKILFGPNTPLKKLPNLPNGVLGKAHKDGTIQIRKGLSKEKRRKVLAHEKQHVKDMKSGKLNYDNSFVYWMGCKYPRTNDKKIIYNGKALPEGHRSFPWEKSANKAV